MMEHGNHTFSNIDGTNGHYFPGHHARPPISMTSIPDPHDVDPDHHDPGHSIPDTSIFIDCCRLRRLFHPQRADPLNDYRSGETATQVISDRATNP